MPRKTKKPDAIKKLFLCHAHADNAFVRKLARDLTAIGVHVWLDEWELTDGDSLRGCIGSALEASAYVGVVLSPASVKSKWCQEELRQALAREMRMGSKLVLPLLHRKVVVPAFLEDRVYADFYRRYYHALAKLAAMVHGVETRSIAEALDRRTPKSTDDVRDILESVGCSTISYLDPAEFEQLRRLLKKAGLPFEGDELDILPVHTSRTKKAAVVRRRLKK